MTYKKEDKISFNEKKSCAAVSNLSSEHECLWAGVFHLLHVFQLFHCC